MARATMRDVAKRAGVSTATVSLVLNKTRFVSDELTRRVTEAMEELGYRPDAVARSLRRQSTKTIGVLIPTILSPFYPPVLKAIDTTISAAGLSMLLANSKEGDESEATLISLMREKRVDGLLIALHSPGSLPQLHEMVADNVPVVVFHRDLAASGLDCVTWEDFEGAYAAVTHLVDSGRRRIAILAPAPLSEVACPTVLHSTGPRLRGYRAALQDAGLPFEESLYLVGRSTEEGQAVTVAR
ncbi:MAG: LacI family DNA-binding transcriptional regulator, partial [Chloroflexota bacterium]